MQTSALLTALQVSSLTISQKCARLAKQFVHLASLLLSARDVFQALIN